MRRWGQVRRASAVSRIRLDSVAATFRSACALVPRATLEIPGGERRLDRISALIRSCRYSLHDLSRVELDTRRPATPRFNMPFELGLAVAWQKIGRQRHTWFVFGSKLRRAEKSLSDLGGTDVYIHNGTVRGVLRELCNAFVRIARQPTVGQMAAIHRGLVEVLPTLEKQSGASPLSRHVFSGTWWLLRKRSLRSIWCERLRSTKPRT
jgi:hypothetical protein